MTALSSSGLGVAINYLWQNTISVLSDASPMLKLLYEIGNVDVKAYGTGVDWQVDYAENTSAAADASEGATRTAGTTAFAKAAISSSTYAVKWDFTKKMKKVAGGDPRIVWDVVEKETKRAYTTLTRAISEQIINGSGSSGELTGFTTAFGTTSTYAGLSRTNTWWQPTGSTDSSDRAMDEDYLYDVYDAIFAVGFNGPNRYCVTSPQQMANLRAIASAGTRNNNVAGTAGGVTIGADPNKFVLNDIPFLFAKSRQTTHPLQNSFYFLDLSQHHVTFISKGDWEVELVKNENGTYVYEGDIEVCYWIEGLRDQGWIDHISV